MRRGKRRRPQRSHRSVKACGAQAAAAADSHWRGRWEAQDGAIRCRDGGRDGARANGSDSRRMRTAKRQTSVPETDGTAHAWRF